MDAEVDEKFKFGADDLISDNNFCDEDLEHIARALGVSDGSVRWGTKSGDADTWDFLNTIWAKAKAYNVVTADNETKMATLAGSIATAKSTLETKIFDMESYLIRTITGVGIEMSD